MLRGDDQKVIYLEVQKKEKRETTVNQNPKIITPPIINNYILKLFHN